MNYIAHVRINDHLTVIDFTNKSPRKKSIVHNFFEMCAENEKKNTNSRKTIL